MKKIAINISKKQYQILKRLSKEDGLPYSEIIRRAIDEYVERGLQNVSHDSDKSAF